MNKISWKKKLKKGNDICHFKWCRGYLILCTNKVFMTHDVPNTGYDSIFD